MVTYNPLSLDRTFGALSDPTRREIIAFLAKSPSNVSRIRSRFTISGPAVTKHLDVLEGAGLILRTKTGRNVLVQLHGKNIHSAQKWIQEYSIFWQQNFTHLDQYLQKKKGGIQKK